MLGKTYVDPFSRGRRSRLAAVNSPAALQKLVDTWSQAIPLHTQYVLGSPDRTAPTLKSLPKGRVKHLRALKSGTPARPLKRRWKYVKNRAIYIDLIEKPDGTLEAYVGIARGAKNPAYLGMEGRCGGYMRDRARGYTHHTPTRHDQALLDPANRINLQLGAKFEADVPLQQVLLLEDVLTVYLRTVQDDGETHRRRTPEVLNLVKYMYV